MKTDDLIKALSTDVRPAMPIDLAWWIAAAIGAVVAATVFFMTIGPRPDIADAMQTVRFPFKFVVTVALAVTAFRLLRILSRPGTELRQAWPWLLLAPALLVAAATLFPEDLLPHLFTLSQVGLLIFMFLVGLEFDHGQLRRLGHTAVLASHASITIPALFGCLAALYLYPRLSSDAVRFREFALFMAVAMSVTAFPVLARILREHRLQDTHLAR